MQLGPAEIIVVLVIALLVFGPTRLPEVGRQVGRAVREIRRFQHTVTRDVREVFDADHEPRDVTHAAEAPPTLPPKVEDVELSSAAGGGATTDAATSDAPSGSNGSQGTNGANGSSGSSEPPPRP